jgi:hypothetical protein
MKLREQLLKEHSRANRDVIVQWVGNKQDRFDELFSLFLTDEYRVVQHAAWPLSYAVINHPAFIRKHLSKLIACLDKPGVHDAVKRNTLRLLQEIVIPKKHHGRLMDACFRYISSVQEPAAIKAFALTVLQNLSKQYPAIIPEIKLVIDENYEHETPAFRSRAKRFLKSISPGT